MLSSKVQWFTGTHTLQAKFKYAGLEGGKDMDDFSLKVIRSGICMGDDVDEHSFTFSCKPYDGLDVLKMLKIIDIWLIELDNVTWKVSNGITELGSIEIYNGVHEYKISYDKPIRTIDFTQHIRCSHIYNK
jgi:hypothetical protein